MSATNRGSERHPDDFYVTPKWVTQKLLEKITIGANDLVLDAGCGDGAISRVLLEAGCHKTLVMGVEKDGRRAILTEQDLGIVVLNGNYLEYPGQADTVIMNPPFSLAMEFVQHSMRVAPKVCALLRLSWLGSQKRATFHREHPSDVLILPKRPSFTNDGNTDASEYAWFCYGFGPGGMWTIL